MTLTKRERLWTVTHDLIEGLGKHFVVPIFGNVKDQALAVAYENIMGHPERGVAPKLTDAEIDTIIVTLVRDMDAP